MGDGDRVLISVSSSTTTRLDGDDVLDVETSVDFCSTTRFDGEVERWMTVSEERSSLTTLELALLERSEVISVFCWLDTFLDGDEEADEEDELDLW